MVSAIIAVVVLFIVGVVDADHERKLVQDISRKNVVFFVADDMRPQMNKAYGVDFMVTPNFDKFATESLVFRRTFCNFAICSASRNSFLSGRVPDKTRTWNFINHFRQGGLSDGVPGSDWVTFPEYFKNNNYTTLGHGKLYHPNKPPNWDEPLSWSQTQPYYPPTNSGCSPNHAGGAVGTWFCPDDQSSIDKFSDHNVTLEAINSLKKVVSEYKTTGQHFFLGLGLHYPHMTHHVPLSIVEKYPKDTNLQPPKNPFAPKYCPGVAFTSELDGQDLLSLNEDLVYLNDTSPPNVSGVVSPHCPWPGNNSVPVWQQQQLRIGYYSAMTLTDMHFGLLMEALNESGIANETLVVVVADHGYQLGEHAEWGKHTNWELAVHVPLMIRAPWLPQSQGQHTDAFVELIDIYKTIASASGLGTSGIAEDVDGIDQSSLLQDPSQPALKEYAFTQYSRCPGKRWWPNVTLGKPDYIWNNCENVPAPNISYMGYSIRSQEYRYTAWFNWNGKNCSVDFSSKPYAVELYSHVNHTSYPIDFDNFENENIVNEIEMKDIVQALHTRLVTHFVSTQQSSCPPPLAIQEPTPLQGGQLILQRSLQHNGYDNCLCTTELCLEKEEKHKYKVVSSEGYLPSEGTSDTTELYHFYCADTGDNLLTTNLSYVSQEYTLVPNLNPAGYVFKNPKSSIPTTSLQLWYSAKMKDHVTCSSEECILWIKGTGMYTLIHPAIGYVSSRVLSQGSAMEVI
eukprot:m.32958 g.32958  ORF g.32958 m.32958 type:complete len:737 (-) comp6423_c0_seq2:179-2389(-)